MRYATYSLHGDATQRLGVVRGDRVADAAAIAAATWPGAFPRTLLELIQVGPDAWKRLSDLLDAELTRNGSTGHPGKDVQWHAPIPRPARNIVCLGQNYLGHMQEAARARGREPKVPEVPIFFTKATNTVSGPYDSIPMHHDVTHQVDWEAELALVIGTRGANIGRSTALGHIFGYTVLNDVSARDIQARHLQFFKGKSLDGFCPMGPVVVTADEFGNPQQKQICCRVNGVVKQHGTTADMIFPIDAIIESLSHGLTLEPGDLIATGTPEGVGLGRTPPEFLQDGDVLETEIEDIGVMRNRFHDL
jgi:2-keto-4-pentenoate hydratase/2-oxohepta-3-ene-1,7-dioic acid hydratase in catechol pathway